MKIYVFDTYEPLGYNIKVIAESHEQAIKFIHERNNPEDFDITMTGYKEIEIKNGTFIISDFDDDDDDEIDKDEYSDDDDSDDDEDVSELHEQEIAFRLYERKKRAQKSVNFWTWRYWVNLLKGN